MQHLRSVGDRPDAHLVEAPIKREQKQKKKEEIAGFVERVPPTKKFVLPEDALPSHPLDEVSYSTYHKDHVENKGLQPDLDPKVREVLEALEDEAYAVDDGEGTDGEDEFWGGVLKGGEGDGGGEWSDEEDEEVDSDMEETGKGIERLKLANGTEIERVEGEGEWDAVKRYNARQKGGRGSDDEEDYESEMGDTIAELVKSNARRPARGERKAGSAMGSSFSMSSSAMHRNEGLRTLDDRFDQVSLSLSSHTFDLDQILLVYRSRRCTMNQMKIHGEEEEEDNQMTMDLKEESSTDLNEKISNKSWTTFYLVTK